MKRHQPGPGIVRTFPPRQQPGLSTVRERTVPKTFLRGRVGLDEPRTSSAPTSPPAHVLEVGGVRVVRVQPPRDGGAMIPLEGEVT
jgi:hypothetical protein